MNGLIITSWYFYDRIGRPSAVYLLGFLTMMYWGFCIWTLLHIKRNKASTDDCKKKKNKPATYLTCAFLACMHTQGTEEFPDRAEQLIFFKLKSFQVRQ